jgi:hypothetical protein
MFSFKRTLAATLALTAGMAGLTLAPAAAAPLPAANIVLKSAISVDPVANTVVLPVHKGTAAGKTVWYIITDSSDKADAAARGVVYAPLLAGVGAVQDATESAGIVQFPGAPDFAPERAFAPGPAGFPPANASPGATAAAAYSPFVRIAGSPIVLNAPIIATGDGPFDVTTHKNTHDRVLAIDGKTVTLLLAHGFVAGHAVVYLSTEASDAGAATIERATFVPSLGKAAAKIPILVFANGQTGAGNTQAQGLAHAALDTHLTADATAATAATLASPRNVLTAFPTGTSAAGYTPLWDATVGVWSPAALAAKKNTLQTNAAAVYALAEAKTLTGPDGKAFGPAGFVVNCPVVAFLNAAP